MTTPGERLTDLGPLRVLLGEWEGRGTWKGDPIGLRARGLENDGFTLLVSAMRDGEIEHAEEVRFHADEADDGCVAAVTRPAPGVEQHWKVFADASVPSFVLLHGDPGDEGVLRLRWTLRFDGPDAYDEVFEVTRPQRNPERDVEARYTRTGKAPDG